MRYTHITKVNRMEILILLKRGYSHREIGRALGINHSSISREIKHNSVKGIYNPDKADHKAIVRREKSKYQGMKIRGNPEIENYVQEKLKLHWSPEEISGRLKNIDRYIAYVSSRGIYKYLYSDYGQNFCQYLYSRRYKVRKRRKKKARREIIKNRVFIDVRPDIINERQRFGDWEADTLGAIISDQQRIAGATERYSRYFLATKVKRLKYAMDGFKLMLNPQQNTTHSITLDNGVENARHLELNTQTYFCHPYSSWEKGSIENSFMRLRRFIPKGSSLKYFANGQMQPFINIMNNTPRKCLNFRTPIEVFNEQLITNRCCT